MTNFFWLNNTSNQILLKVLKNTEKIIGSLLKHNSQNYKANLKILKCFKNFANNWSSKD
ncbi:hypothetical protein DICPUDRAFT_152065 [Dictyostelium purpureum]|uniref:Uncharacterized protein n=1 Tax=Dictyostelium purpureum TaxID=5786 RepID=F0ZKD9_DICPU|nr:uncharacterized protein DICPUDRAFT_152065 [Dictyostelium purpureum]EGC35592.1 hypothetical protein DICPUDRAFT_152065 [Dictyostelium purpureum]|eukprot:XP_003287895.1 hypothetical protein DICPUDRAFT_152065 [Dictyostelium purpureum]